MQIMNLKFWIIIGVYILGWYLQTNLLFNSDTSWLMEASRRMLAGGTYTADYAEVNPPMILYIYAPVIMVAKTLSLNVFIILRLYVYALASLSSFVAWSLLRKIITPDDSLISSLLLIVISVIFLLLPLYEFGQREHLMLILTLPYFLLVVSRLSGNQFHSSYLPLLTGVMAGIGFAIKPYFILAFVMTELYFIYRKRHYLASLRMEVMSVVAVISLYLLLIVLFHQDYLLVILPQTTTYFYQKGGIAIRTLLLLNESFYFYFTALFYFIRGRHFAYANLAAILMIAAFGFYLSNIMQRMYLYYHVLPMLAMCILLLSLLFAVLVTSKRVAKAEWLTVGAYSLLLLSYILYRLNYIWLGIVYYPAFYFALFAALFSFLLYAAYGKDKWWRALLSVAVLLAFNYFFYCVVQCTIWQKHLFALTTAMFYLSYIYFIPDKMDYAKLKYAYFSIVGALLFAYPFYLSGYNYETAIYFKNQYMRLVNVISRYPEKSIYFLTDSCYLPFPAIEMTHNKLASRFACMTGLPLVTELNQQLGYKGMYVQYKKNIDYYINAVTDDFKHNEPALVFVDIRAPNRISHLIYYGNMQIDYLQLFQLDPVFAKVWEHYHFVKTVDGQPLFKFNIYERNA